MNKAAAPWGWLAAQLAFAALVTAAMFWRWPVPDGAIELASAELEGQRVALPDDARRRGGPERFVRYRLDTAGLDAAPVEPWMLLLPSVRMNAAARVNGVVVGTPAAPGSREWLRPIAWTIAPTLLRAGANRIEIDVEADAPGRGYLGLPLLGPERLLAPLARARGLAQHALAQWSIGMTLVVSALMLMLWTLRRRDTVYLWYGAGMGLWGLHNLNFVVAVPPLPLPVWEATMYSLLGGFIALATGFVHRYLGSERRRLEKFVAAGVLGAMPLLFVLPGDWARTFGDRIWNPAVMAVGLYLCLHTHASAWRRRDPLLQLLAANGSLVALLGVHDLLISVGARPWGEGYLFHYTAAPSLIVFTALLIVRFAQTLNAAERSNDELEVRVAAAVQESRAAQQRLVELERSRWLGAERERIARDMHDGVGGHLVALLARLRTGRLTTEDTEAALSHAMEDLRLAIDSLEVDAGDLPTALAKFRHRLERRLRDTPLKLVWHPAPDAPVLPGYGPAEILHVLRILDEASSNVLRHADAHELTLSYAGSGECWTISLADDGVGGARETDAGHGLRNMRRRAAALGALLRVADRPEGRRGTNIELELRARRVDSQVPGAAGSRGTGTLP